VRNLKDFKRKVNGRKPLADTHITASRQHSNDPFYWRNERRGSCVAL